MEAVLFTKLFGNREVEEIADVVARLGFDGTDLLIRPGTAVTPDNVSTLPTVTDIFERAGSPIKMATTDLIKPDDVARKVLSACSDADIRMIRLGYWPYDVNRGFADCIKDARTDLDGLQELAAELGVTLLIQLHGETLHASGATTSLMLEGRDPELVAAYPDPGNQTVQDGREDWRMTFDILSNWLRCVGVKNGGWFPGVHDGSGQRPWVSDWMNLDEGMVPWNQILNDLKSRGFDGLLTLHSHYELPYEQVLNTTEYDLRYVRQVLGQS